MGIEQEQADTIRSYKRICQCSLAVIDVGCKLRNKALTRNSKILGHTNHRDIANVALLFLQIDQLTSGDYGHRDLQLGEVKQNGTMV